MADGMGCFPCTRPCLGVRRLGLRHVTWNRSRDDEDEEDGDFIVTTRVVSHQTRSDTPNITWVVSRLARSDTPNITWVVTPWVQSPIRPHNHPPLHQFMACIFINYYSTNWPQRKKYECQKYENKSPIHENADANITWDFGDGDISRLGVGCHIHTSLARL